MAAKRKTGPKLAPGEMRKRVRTLYEAGFCGREIADRLGVTKSTVAFHMRRFDVPIDDRYARRYNWLEIGAAYEIGASMAELQEKYGFSRFAWYDAVRRGDIVLRQWMMPLAVAATATGASA